jgi:hypothetical protein
MALPPQLLVDEARELIVNENSLREHWIQSGVDWALAHGEAPPLQAA